MFKIILSIIFILQCSLANAQGFGRLFNDHARGVRTTTTEFDGVLSASDDTVQKALDTIDDNALTISSASTIYVPYEDAIQEVDLGDKYIVTNGATIDYTISGIGGIDGNTIVLLHADGADMGSVFTDSSLSPHTVTPSGSVTKTSIYKFETASAFFDGANDDLTITYSSDLNIGSGDFTIEAWVYPDNYPSPSLGYIFCDKPTATGTDLRLYVKTDGAITGHIGNKSITTSTSLTLDTWNHVMFVHDSGTMTIYLDGVSRATGSSSGNNWANTSQNRSIGSGDTGQDRYFDGYIDEIRISNIARKTAGFTPETEEYSFSEGVPVLDFSVGETTKWSVGSDGADGDNFKIGKGSNLTTDTALEIDADDIVIANRDVKIQADGAKEYFGAGDDYSIEWDGSDAVHTVSSGDFVFTGGEFGIGVDNTQNGTLNLYGSGTGSAEGGQLNLWLAADHDGTVDTYIVDAYQEEIRIFPYPTTSWIHYLRSDGDVEFAGNVELSNDGKKLYFGAGDDYSIEWDGSDAVHTISSGDFVFTGGNIGKGTTSPSTQFHVYNSTGGNDDNLRVEVADSAGSFMSFKNSAETWKFGMNGSEDFVFGDSGAAAIFTIQNGAPLGILTLTSGGHLKLQADSKKLYLGASDDYSIEFDGSDAVHTITSGDFVFTGGNVGIGTSSPKETLHILKGAGAGGINPAGSVNLVIERNANTGIQFLTLNTNKNTLYFGDSNENNVGRIEYDHNNDDLSFWTSATENLNIDSSGNVHILKDNQKLYFGAGDDMQLWFDGANGKWVTGSTNVIIGNSNTGSSLTSGEQNIIIGENAGTNVSTTDGSVYVGYWAGRLATGRENTAIGAYALDSAVTGERNVAIGNGALSSVTSGSHNASIGKSTGVKITTGSHNVLFGRSAGGELTTNSNNTFLGAYSGSSSTGGSNIFLGYNSGSKQTTNSNLFIIDNQERADAATELTNAIIYGTMASAPADQDLYLNADVYLQADNRELYFGAGDDYSIHYDGTDTYHTNSSGDFYFSGGDVAVIDDVDFRNFRIGESDSKYIATAWRNGLEQGEIYTSGYDYPILLNNSIFIDTDTNSGNVGIGTVSPQKKLDIDGTIRVKEMYNSNTGSSWIIKQETAANRGLYFNNTSGTWSFYNLGVSKVDINTSGDISLGRHIYQSADNSKHYFGAGDDASLYYDGTNFIFNSQDAGTGDFRFLNGDLELVSSTGREGALRFAGGSENILQFGAAGDNVARAVFGMGALTVGNGGAVNTFPDGDVEILGDDAEIQVDFTNDGNVHIVHDNAKLYFGAGDDYSIEWDGSDATHTATAGEFNFIVDTDDKGIVLLTPTSAETALKYSSSGGGNQFYSKNDAGTITAQIRSYAVDSVQGFFTAGNIGIGTSSASKLLHVYAGASGATENANARTIIEDDDHAVLQILTPNTKIGGITFGDPESSFAGYVRYNHDDDTMKLYSASVEAISIDSSQNLHIPADSKKLYFGAGDDASITYDGSNLIINPQEVGSGKSLFYGTTGAKTVLVRSDTTTNTDDLLGSIGFDSTDGGVSTVDASVIIEAFASELHSSGDKGGYLTISTKPTNHNPGESAIERLRITNEGYVGIGTSSPDIKLHVVDNSGVDVMKLESDDGPALSFEDTGESETWRINTGGSPTSMFFQHEEDSKFWMDSSGNFKLLKDSGKLYFGAGDDDSLEHDGVNLVITPANGMVISNDTTISGVLQLQDNGNSCDIIVDADATCDTGTKIGEDNSIAICLSCS